MSEFETNQALSVVYVLTNPAMPGLVKIGRTSQEQAKARLDQLYTTGVPVPFELQFACRVPNPTEVELALHRAFAPQRINPKREFFRLEADQVISILRLLHVEEKTAEIASQPSTIPPSELAATVELRARRPNLNFHEMGIPSGAILQFRDGDIAAVVSGPKKVVFDGEESSLTAVTKQLLGTEYAVAPAPYWLHNGRSLREIYNETYPDDG